MIELDSKIQDVLTTLEQLGDEFAVESQAEWSTKARKQGMRTVKLWQVPRTTGELLYSLVKKHQPHTILELGTSAGYSALWMGAAAAEYSGHVYTIDSASMKVDMAQQYIQQAGLDTVVHVIHAPIADALEQPGDWAVPVDMLFLDADKKNYLRFFKLIEPHLSPNAIIVADDAIKIRHAMEDFIATIENSPQYEVSILEQDHGVLIAQRHQ